MKVAIVAVMVVLAMGVAFVGGLLVALKMTGMSQEQTVKKGAPIVAAQVKLEEQGAKHIEGEMTKEPEKEHGEKAKKEPKKPTTDDMIALIDYSVSESRDAGKLLFRKKVAENMEAAEKQLELESDKAKEKNRLAASVQRWLARSRNY